MAAEVIDDEADSSSFKDIVSTTCMISASFEDNYQPPLNATAWANMLDGTRYAACTTIQYGYKPAYNTTWLTVEPQATEVMQPTKTQEEMQKEAEQSGGLAIWHEFSWWYPWYRLHVAITINGAKIDIGFSPLLPDIGARQFYFPNQFLPPIPITIDPELAKQIIRDMIIGTAVEVFGFAGTAVAAANTHIPASSAFGLAIYVGGLGLLFGYAWSLHNSGKKLEALSTLIGFAVNAIGAGLGGLLHCAFLEATAIFTDSIMLPILGTVLSNLINPQELIISMGATIAILITSLIIGLIALHFIPDPINAWFYPVFIIASFTFVITAFHYYDEWAR